MSAGVELIVDFLSYVKDQLFTWLPLIFLGLLVYFFWRMLAFMPRVKPMEVEPDSKSAVGWDDIAGVDEAASELQEVVDFLQHPKRFSVLGARVPKGILLYGPPGTGKTLLAKAVAHASGATFYSQSASAFVEMFAGLGAARIRKLFDKARKNAPAIVFIDELDAVGMRRSGTSFNREHDQTQRDSRAPTSRISATRRPSSPAARSWGISVRRTSKTRWSGSSPACSSAVSLRRRRSGSLRITRPGMRSCPTSWGAHSPCRR
jgi:Na+-transporting methylmalonyl-CoA/oxaloacetate decarboxylase gamma subunit